MCDISDIVIIILFLLFIGGCFTSFKGNSHDCTMTLFYSPHCGHCIRLKPEWDKFTNMVCSSVKIRQFNIRDPKNKRLAMEYGIKGVPHIVKEKYGKRVVYKGPRKAQDIFQFAMN